MTDLRDHCGIGVLTYIDAPRSDAHHMSHEICMRLARRPARDDVALFPLLGHRQDAETADHPLIATLGDINQGVALGQDAGQRESAAALPRDLHAQLGRRS